MTRQKNIIPACLSLALLAGLTFFTASAAEFLTNGGFNNPYYDVPERTWNGQHEKVAEGWHYFFIEANTYDGNDDASKLHWMSSAQFAETFGGLDYHIEGDQAQIMWSSYEYEAGLYQQISGLTPGQGYRFNIKMVTYWRGPGYPDSDGVMIKQVGIDPYGGTDPTGKNVVWSETDDNDKFWSGMKVAATAETETMTVFAKVYAPENDSWNHTDLDMVYFEDSHLSDLVTGPSTQLNASPNSPQIDLSWSGSPTSGWSLKGYEVRYREQSEEYWIILQEKNNTATSRSFTGQAGNSYLIRARTWQTNGDIDLPGQWAEEVMTLGPAIMGRVTNHAGMGLSGVTVALSGTTTTTLSENGGRYILPTGSGGTFYVKATDFNDLVAPPAMPVTLLPGGIEELTLTLRPGGAHQALTNNDFETDLSGWTVSGPAIVSTTHRHTGAGSLLLTGNAAVTQTGLVTDMRLPLLSFWYKTDPNAVLEVEFLGPTGPIQARTLNAADQWSFITLESGLDEHYSGPAGVQLKQTGGTNVYIDEVSIGPGFLKNYLPLIVKK